MSADINTATRPRRPMARDTDASSAPTGTLEPASTSKLDRLEAMLCSDTGASIADMMAATGWQQHSVRGAMAGALKKRGLAITSEKTDGLRRYRAVRA